ncbi:MAG: ribosome assembly cofactor RimP [Ichthyobacteriaceae bacterium]|nr:ribosome assembly cofactor RimP [Ichthyobacteriaceae bacterium]
MDKDKVKYLLTEALGRNEELFLVSFDISTANQIFVVIDGDNGVPVSECIRISRSIEQNLDREEGDFSLEVATFDVAHSLILPRQYEKNVGRKLKIKTIENEKFEGDLISFSEEDGVLLKWKERVPKTLGKGKVTVEKEQAFSLDSIKEAKVVIIF